MKKILIIWGLMISAFSAWAQNPHTDDHLEISEAEVDLGGEYKTVTASVANIASYTAFGLDIYLPEGYQFVQLELENADEEIEWMYASKGGACKSTHAVMSNPQSDGALRVTANSSTSATFKTSAQDIFKFYIKATSYAKPGAASIQIKNCFFVTSNGTKYVTDDITISDKVSATSSTSIPFTVSATNQFSTCILPFDATIPDGVKAYECAGTETEGEETYLVLTEANTFEAYTPYIVYSESGYSGSLNGTVDASKYPVRGYVTKGLLNGSIEPQMVSEGYVMQNKGDGAMFYNMGGQSFLVPSGKCWLSTTNAPVNAVRIRHDNSADIETAVGAACEDGAIYNLQGLKVNSIPLGQIYIKGNKKYIVK